MLGYEKAQQGYCPVKIDPAGARNEKAPNIPFLNSLKWRKMQRRIKNENIQKVKPSFYYGNFWNIYLQQWQILFLVAKLL